MKRGQGPLGIVVGLGVIIFLLAVIAWAFRPTATGNVVIDNNFQEGNFIPEPFKLKAWIVNPSGIQLDIQNSGSGDILVESVEVKGCGLADYGRMIEKGKSELFSIKCDLTFGEKFSGILILKYSENGEEKSAAGNVEDTV